MAVRDEIEGIFQNDERGFFLMAGPCVVESSEVCQKIASRVASECARLCIPFVFKASFKKANRTRVDSFTGLGDDIALEILLNIKRENEIPVMSDVHEVRDVHLVKDVVDIIQIPAFLCRQTDLLIAAGETGLPVHIKKGQFMDASAMKFAVEKVRAGGSDQIIVTERGNSFGYSDLVVDMRNLHRLKEHGTLVGFDCTHSNQRPNQPSGVTGGSTADEVSLLARSAVAAGIDGIFMELHPTPETAMSDSSTMLSLDEGCALLDQLSRIAKVID